MQTIRRDNKANRIESPNNRNSNNSCEVYPFHIVHRDVFLKARMMDSFFSPLIHQYNNLDRHYDLVIGDIPWISYLYFLALNLDLKTLEPLMLTQKKKIREQGSADVFEDFANILLEPNCLYAAKVISLLVKRYSHVIYFVGTNLKILIRLIN